MGILNVTPDSFSDGGLFAATDAAIRHGLALHAAGADLVDVGGESTRPGADRVPVDLELARVLPVVRELAAAGVACSVDTTRSDVAEAAVAAGAVLVNDVSGGLADPMMARVVAACAVPWVVMHWRAHSAAMAAYAEYDDVVVDVRDELQRRLDTAMLAGVAAESIVIDPGLGFAKRAEHNWEILGRLDELRVLGFPVLIGASRKRFLPASGHPAGSLDDLRSRDFATAAITAYVASREVWGVRVHDAEGNVRAAEVITALSCRVGGGLPGGAEPVAGAPVGDATATRSGGRQ